MVSDVSPWKAHVAAFLTQLRAVSVVVLCLWGHTENLTWKLKFTLAMSSTVSLPKGIAWYISFYGVLGEGRYKGLIVHYTQYY